ncbi:hypothetical protein JF539_07625 [Labrenzia aggregata]|uniref:Uncharacterized protein n=1 Tax=Roseibium aggregatum TaxID=187304 RepID=A0A939ECQ4_9HYPH|nr:hypothetical protein [Roseibium aggregatum]
MIIALLNQKGGVVFADAAQSGHLASEIDRQSPAAREIAALTSVIGRFSLGKVAV